MKRKKWQFRNWILFVGLYDEGTVRRRVAVDRSGIDINEGNDNTRIILGVTRARANLETPLYKKFYFFRITKRYISREREKCFLSNLFLREYILRKTELRANCIIISREELLTQNWKHLWVENKHTDVFKTFLNAVGAQYKRAWEFNNFIFIIELLVSFFFVLAFRGSSQNHVRSDKTKKQKKKYRSCSKCSLRSSLGLVPFPVINCYHTHRFTYGSDCYVKRQCSTPCWRRRTGGI